MIHVRKSGIASIQLTSDSEYSVITFGENISASSDNGQIRYGYGNALGDAQFSTEQSLDIINHGIDNLNFYLNPSGLGTAFNWLTNASTRAMVLTGSGNLGINSTSPSDRLSVGGDASITGNLSVIGSNKTITGQKFAKVGGSSTEFLKADGSVDNSTYLTLSSGILTAVSGDSNPKLGGELNLEGNNILDTAGSNISVFGNISCGGTITAEQGFKSSGQSVKIIVTGSTLTFNVVGVGSTSLTLL